MDETNQRPGIKYSIEKSVPTIDSIAVEIPIDKLLQIEMMENCMALNENPWK